MRHAPAYEIRNLRKVYDSPEVVANDGISFTVEPGESFGLLGPNGAGKSTLVRQLVGLSTPTSGEINLFGEKVDGRRQAKRIGRTVAYLPQGSLSLGELKVGEAVRYTGMLRGCNEATAIAETQELLDVLTIADLADRPIRKLSGGQKRLTQIAMTLVGRLPVVILDEPTGDIDPALRLTIWELVQNRAGAGAAVILVTHDVAEAEHALDRVAIMDRGKVIAAGTPAELKSELSHRTRLEIVVADGAALDATSLAREIAVDARVRGRRVSAWVVADEAIRILEKAMAMAGPGALEDARLITPTLEDVYMELRDGSLSSEADS
ncbi:MAG: type transport system ATP-binding protein [Actinomycetota bacterium]|jgi:ABC-2 type transport system ATP-binding protein|nr:type transport system ATP-binding protein [Actinomycetota bacterium]